MSATGVAFQPDSETVSRTSSSVATMAATSRSSPVSLIPDTPFPLMPCGFISEVSRRSTLAADDLFSPAVTSRIWLTFGS